MPQIIVMADHIDREREPVMLRERINVGDFESERFAANLVERLGWAVLDATEFERAHPERDRPTPDPAGQRSRDHQPRGHRRSARVVTTAS